MSILKNKYVLASLVTFSLINASIACTNITLKAKDNTVVVGRTLEFGPDLKSSIYLKGRNTPFSNKTESGKETLRWQGKYGYIYANGFDLDFAIDGMNEKGLSIAYLYLPRYTKYNPFPKKLSPSQKAISFINLSHWILSQYDRVSKLKDDLPHLTIYRPKTITKAYPNVTFEAHMVIVDESGDSIVVEWLDGKTHIYQNNVGVLTNSPSFKWQNNNLKNYLSLSPYSPKPILFGDIKYSVNGEGSSWLGLPGDFSPPSRFVKMAYMLKSVIQPDNGESALVLAQHIIGNVYIPKGFIRDRINGQDQYETTQWSVFKNLTKKQFYFTSYDYPMLQLVDLNKIDFSKDLKSFQMPLAHPNLQSIDVTDKLMKR